MINVENKLFSPISPYIYQSFWPRREKRRRALLLLLPPLLFNIYRMCVQYAVCSRSCLCALYDCSCSVRAVWKSPNRSSSAIPTHIYTDMAYSARDSSSRATFIRTIISSRLSGVFGADDAPPDLPSAALAVLLPPPPPLASLRPFTRLTVLSAYIRTHLFITHTLTHSRVKWASPYVRGSAHLARSVCIVRCVCVCIFEMRTATDGRAAIQSRRREPPAYTYVRCREWSTAESLCSQ